MYRLYLDEHGTDTLKRLKLDGYRYFSLTGVAMKVDHARDFLVPSFNRIKASILDEDPDSPICFHRSDIRRAAGPFEKLKDTGTRKAFDESILGTLRDSQYTVVSVVIDKKAMAEQHHWSSRHPYHFLMEVMVEKYAQFLNRMADIGDIMPEARGRNQDQALQSEFEDLKLNGTRYASKELVQYRIPSTSLKFRTKRENIAGLQLCDLLAHPSHYTIRHNMNHPVELGPFAKRVSDILRAQKYDRSAYGKVWGYGAKYLP